MSDVQNAGNRPAGTGRAAQRRAMLLNAQILGIGTFYVLLVIFFAFTTGNFFTYSNAVNILSNITVLGIVALGQTMAIVSGGFDLSVSGTVPLGAVCYVLLTNAGYPVSVSILAVLCVGLAVGLLNGIVITKVGISPLIATLGMLSITAGLALTLSRGVTLPMRNLDAGFLSDFAYTGISYYVLLLIGLCIAVDFLMRFTMFGRMIYAVGGNREASRLAGIRVDGVSIVIYMLCGMLATLAGIVVASQLLAGSANVGADVALASVAAVILGGASLFGGVGTVVGTLMGVLVLGTIANGMALMMVPAFYQQMANGAILLLAVGLGRLRDIYASD